MPTFRLTITFHGDTTMLAWTIRRIIDTIRTSPVPMTLRFERVDDQPQPAP